MRDCGRYAADLTGARGVYKGLCMQYKDQWGDDAFVPQRKQPFKYDHVLQMIALLSSQRVLKWPAVMCRAILVALCHALSTGARRDEWTLTHEHDTYVRRCNFEWVDDDGGALPSTPEVIKSRRNGHLLRGRSAASKCDRLNIFWGARDMWFRYDDTNPLYFAWRWQQWEMAHPCPLHERRTWPAFSPFGNEVPFTPSVADAKLHELMRCVMTVAEAMTH